MEILGVHSEFCSSFPNHTSTRGVRLYLFYIVEFRSLLPCFHFQVTENPTQTGLSTKDNLFIYITKKSRDNWLQVHLVPQVNYVYFRDSFLRISQICFLASTGLRLQMLMAAPMDWVRANPHSINGVRVFSERKFRYILSERGKTGITGAADSYLMVQLRYCLKKGFHC